MKKGALNDFSLRTNDFSSLAGLPDLAFVNEHFGMFLNIGPYRDRFVRPGQPYRFVEGRIMWITGGSADLELTLEEYHVSKGDIMLLAPESIVEQKSCSDDFTMMGIIYKEDMPVDKSLIIHAGEDGWQETVRLADILWDVARQAPFRLVTVGHLLSAIISCIQDMGRAELERNTSKVKTRQEQVFGSFKKLVNEHCRRHRNIRFYADELALTPHYLSGLVAATSGRSVMWWINRATLVQAKVLFRSKDTLVSEVAERLNFPSLSAFGTFFKRETGMTPSEYQRADAGD